MFDSTDLWLRTLGDIQIPATERLRASFRSFRERASLLAGEIQRYLPTLTVHDITHIDALWEVADTIIGSTYPINPAEAYVLGGSFLLHDTAMSLAAYPKGLESIKCDPNWEDCVARLLKARLKRMPRTEELDSLPKHVEDEAVSELLRRRHAEQAERLATAQWTSRDGKTLHLIEDDWIRTTYGRLIGRIAHSHWWPIDKLRAEFKIEIGAPPWAPRNWTVDPLKLACILRCADAAHIDDRRSPRFLAALRQVSGVSANHWSFQSRLPRLRINNDRVVFSCATPFPVEEAEAWWLCLDATRMIDMELRQTDALLADTGKARFTARSVAGADDSERLRQFIPTEGWDPVETRVRVTDVPLIVERLGGRELYGDNPTVPLRKLLQNAIDAVRARRIIEARPESWGTVSVRIGMENDGAWLEVEDSGLGMSKAVLRSRLEIIFTVYDCFLRTVFMGALGAAGASI